MKNSVRLHLSVPFSQRATTGLKMHSTNMRLPLTYLILMFSAASLHSETLRHRRGFVYENVKIREVQAGRVNLSHDSGIGWVNFEDLDPASMSWIEKQPEYQKFKDEQEKSLADERQREIAEAKAKAARETKTREELERKNQAAEKIEKERNDAVAKEFKQLAENQNLWVSDFRKLEKLLKIDEVFPGSYMFATTPDISSSDSHFISKFGKPDKEQTHNIKTTTYDTSIRKIPGPDVCVRELTYENRLLNPTTEKKENLTIEFYNGFYRRSVAIPSGNTSR